MRAADDGAGFAAVGLGVAVRKVGLWAAGPVYLVGQAGQLLEAAG